MFVLCCILSLVIAYFSNSPEFRFVLHVHVPQRGSVKIYNMLNFMAHYDGLK